MTYGKFWQEAGLEFFEWCHKGRKVHHKIFMEWLDENFSGESVLEIGCGYGVFYPEYFKSRDIGYLGLDIAEPAIRYCSKNRPGEFLAQDVTEWQPPMLFDLVFSQGVIDNTPNMDLFIASHAYAASQWVYITACRGYFPNLKEHRYYFNADQQVYYNELSIPQAIETLNRCGCKDIHTKEFKGEAIIVARK